MKTAKFLLAPRNFKGNLGEMNLEEDTHNNPLTVKQGINKNEKYYNFVRRFAGVAKYVENQFSILKEKEIEELFGSLSKPVEGEMMLEDLLITLGAATSKREARTFITGNSVLLNGEKVTDPKMVLSQKDAMYGKYLLVRRGKKNYYLGVF